MSTVSETINNIPDSTLIKNLTKNPHKIGNKITIDQLSNIVKYATEKYHKSGDPIFEDDIFDIIREVLVKRDPSNPVLKEIGTTVLDMQSVPLPRHMGSMDKFKPDNVGKMDRWKEKYKGPYVVSEKLDGTSALLHHFKEDKSDDKWSSQFFTRGSGDHGKDISAMFPYFVKTDVRRNLHTNLKRIDKSLKIICHLPSSKGKLVV